MRRNGAAMWLGLLGSVAASAVLVPAPVLADDVEITVSGTVPAFEARPWGSLATITVTCGASIVTVDAVPSGTWSATLDADVNTSSCHVRHEAATSATLDWFVAVERDVAITGQHGTAAFSYPDPITMHRLDNGNGSLLNILVDSAGSMTMPDGQAAVVRTRAEATIGSSEELTFPFARSAHTMFSGTEEPVGQTRGTLDSRGAEALTYVNNSGLFVGLPDVDTDGDGAVDVIERGGGPLVPRSSHGAGDGNLDGVLDELQPDIETVYFYGREYLTFRMPAGATMALTPLTMRFGPEVMGSPAVSGPVMAVIGNLAPGSDATLHIDFQYPMDVVGYATFDLDGAWWETAWDVLPSGRVVVGPQARSIAVTFTDGGPGDGDGSANGVIEFTGAVLGPVDDVGPTVDCEDPPTGWSADDIFVLCTAADSGAGVSYNTIPWFELRTMVAEGTETDDAHTYAREVCDDFMTCTQVEAIGGLKVDKKAPVIAIDAPAGELPEDAVVLADYACTDGGSGVASCVGDVPDGDPIDTSVLGPASITVIAIDEVGNKSEETVTYTVVAAATDADGVDGAVEDAGPNGGDGNGDGVADSAQDNVTSLPGWTGGYVTIAGPLGTSLVGVSAVDPSLHGTPPAGYTLPDGLLSFTLDIGAASQATVRIFTPSAGSVNGYAKFHDGVWSLLPASNVTVDPSGDWVDVTLVDGGIGDDDEVVNGTIVDPGGVVLVADNVAPAVTCAAAPTTWSKTDISIACTATDAGSGLAQAGDASFSLSTSVPDGTETANASTGSRSVCDVAGNCSSVGPFTGLKVDKQAPSITITSPTGADVNRGQTLTARYSCADAGSGVATCAGPVRNNSNINTSVAGQFSFTVNATDRAGNTSTTTVPYRVLAPNAAPTVRADMGISGLQEVGFQSRTVTLTGSFADPDGTAPYTASVQWAAGAAFTPASVTGNQIAASFTYPSAGTRTVTVKVCDVRGACGTDTVKVRAGVTVKVTPVVQCVTDRGSRQTPRYEARFGYTNPAGYAIVIPTTATENTFTSSPSLRGQPQIFRAGTQRNVFTVGFASGTQSWRLNGTTVSASPSTRRC